MKSWSVGMDGGKRRVDSRFVAAGDVKDSMVIDQIMLRFLSIAPRPVTAESSGHPILKDGMLKRKRVKRKYVRVKKKKNKNDNDNKSWLDSNGNELVFTDPFRKVTNWISFGLPEINSKGIMNNLNKSDSPEKSTSDLHGVDLAMAVKNTKLVESWITVESVTGTCEDQRLLGYTDDEIWKNLETDSCPAFTSNSFDEVLWVNQAYRRMLDLNSAGDGGGCVASDKATMLKYLPAFSCRVRIEYRICEKKTQMVVPCDVCKLDSGGYAWRLDVKFALSLGPLN